MNIIWFCLVSYGLTQMLVYGKIFDNIRPTEGKLGELFCCTMCMGFWVGLFLWMISGFTELFNYDSSIVTGFLLACASSGVSYAFSTVLGDEGLKIEIEKTESRRVL